MALGEDIDGGDVKQIAVLAAVTGRLYDFSIKAKSDSYQEISRVRFQIMKVAPLNWAEAGLSRLEDIALYE